MALSLAKLLRALETIKSAITTVQPTLPDDINAAALQQEVDAVNAVQQQLDQLNLQRKKLVNDKRVAIKKASGMVSRIRSFIRASYGPDSNEFEMFGGVRTSERKKRTATSG